MIFIYQKPKISFSKLKMPANTGLGGHVENNNEVVGHCFDLFSKESIEKAMDYGFEQEVHTTTNLNNDGPYEFVIPPSTDFMYLPHTRLYIKGNIRGANNAVPLADAAVSVCNLFPHALFRQIDVNIGGINTSSQDMLYPYKAFFETLFTYSSIAKQSHLKSCSAWAEDTVGQYDALTDDNNGFDTRKVFINAGRTFDFCIPLHGDIFQCPRLIPPNTPVKINLSRMNDNFSLMCANADNYRINITHLSLFVRKIVPFESLGKMISHRLIKDPVILPFSRSILKRETVPQGTTNVHLPLFNGELPRQILITMVASNRLDGRKNLNPFKFQHFTTRYVNLRINGMSEPSKPYEPDFDNEIFSRELRALYDNTGVTTGDVGYNITREAFADGMTFFSWDTSADHCNGYHIHSKKRGRTVDLDLSFRNALTEPINILIYATYETSIDILNGQVVDANFVNG